ncbi:periplasmic solute-binding protein [Saccharospirillum salsuginis]|uniref:Periplasmic solute-binding protein n=2 Tax=Saccharospirillum salsuginis TaxID=418750 RepID=A0A918K4I3_9GAMM|nr:periplasmic solute-binding protein [Saccharospirillum salsuginis]
MRFILFLGVWLLLAPVSLLAACERPVQVGWAPWPPYQYLDNGDRPAGLDIDMVEAVLDEMGCERIYQNVPWKRRLLHIESGKLDVIAGASYVPERDEYGRFSQPYRQESVVVFARPEDAERLSDESNLLALGNERERIATVLGYYYGEDFERAIRDPDFRDRVFELPTEEAAFRMLEAGRVTTVVADPYVAARSFSRNPQWGQLVPVETLYRTDIHFLLSRASLPADFATEFDAALERLERRGVLNRIRDRYELHQSGLGDAKQP